MGFQNAAALLPPMMRKAALAYRGEIIDDAEEFRLRRGYPPTVVVNGVERVLESARTREEDLRWVVERAS
jgi:hypothetical protein